MSQADLIGRILPGVVRVAWCALPQWPHGDVARPARRTRTPRSLRTSVRLPPLRRDPIPLGRLVRGTQGPAVRRAASISVDRGGCRRGRRLDRLTWLVPDARW